MNKIWRWPASALGLLALCLTLSGCGYNTIPTLE